jgi:Radical SAM superfamily
MDINKFRDELNSVSPSFCVAKWKQVTLHLQTGHNHSCHHPAPHKIPLEELSANPSALHNTKFKKLQRKMMLSGERPAECDYCWRVEDNSNSLSDRIFKSADKWAAPHIQDIASKPWDHDVVPSYVEVSFGNVCNFKCSYCAPNVSSRWMEEIEKFGPYPTSGKFNNLEWLKQTDQMPIPHKDDNPYVDAFWEWWPTAYRELEHFRITGGEPLLNKNTFKILDYIIANPNPNLDFSINANMCPPNDILDKFIEKIKLLEGKVKRFKIFTSAEAYGAQAEYIRNGMDYAQWIDNIERVLKEVPSVGFTIMSTYNALSVPSYTKFLQDVLRLKTQYYKPEYKQTAVLLDIPYLRWPPHQSIFILTKDFATTIKEHVDFVQSYAEGVVTETYQGFDRLEVERMKRIYEIFQSHDEPDTVKNQKDFVAFVDEHDRRRGTNFSATFPEMVKFYNYCQQL